MIDDQAPEALLDEPPVLGQADTIAAMLAAAKRIGGAAPIRASFVQQGERGKRRPGPLADLVRSRDEIALDLLLLTVAVASAPPHDIARPAQVWLRALGRSPESKSSATALSRAWRRLEERRLVRRSRAHRTARIELLREDGSGEPYTNPSGTAGDVYFKLPLLYWEEGLNQSLSLRGKALLLISLSLLDGFVLPYERAPEWYGISADTAQRGLKELLAHDLLAVVEGYKRAPLTAQGWTVERRYSLPARLRVPPVLAAPERNKRARRGDPKPAPAMARTSTAASTRGTTR